MKHTVSNQIEANAKVTEIAAGLKVYWGTGSPIKEPHVVVVPDHFELRVWIFPKGDGYGLPSQLERIAW